MTSRGWDRDLNGHHPLCKWGRMSDAERRITGDDCRCDDLYVAEQFLQPVLSEIGRGILRAHDGCTGQYEPTEDGRWQCSECGQYDPAFLGSASE